MADNPIHYEDHPDSGTSYLTTELNSLADGGRVLGGAIDNGTDGDTFIMVEVALAAQGGARDAGGSIDLFFLPSVDGGTTYSFGDASNEPSPTNLAGSLVYDAATTARVLTVQIPNPPNGHFKILVKNSTGQALAATTNTVKYAVYSKNVVTA
jgi:hypothetical protein